MKSFSGNTVALPASGYWGLKLIRVKVALTIATLFLSTGIQAINPHPPALPVPIKNS